MATNFTEKDLTAIEDEKNVALTEAEKQTNTSIAQWDKFTQDAVNKIGVQDENGNWNEGSWADTQSKNQQEQTDFAIKEIEQNKEYAEKDYKKEQAGAYVDWQKQSNPYGVNAERMASNGLTNTGYSESSQVAMYNQYQNRVAVARESFTRTITDYNNAITNARLQNNVALAEIAYKALTDGLNYMMQGMLKKDELLSNLSTQKMQIESLYQSKYTDILDQINAQESLALQKRQVKIQEEQWAAEKEQMENAVIKNTSGGSNSGAYRTAQKEKFAYKKAQSNINKSNQNTVTTDYFSGTLPEATKVAQQKYGTFSNGYQPKGVAGHGKVKKTGETIEVSTKTLSGEKRVVIQNVWKSEDGVLWYWEGREMTYKRVPMK